MRALLVVVSVLLLTGVGRAEDDPLTTRLEQALQRRALRGATVAALVVDAADGSVLFERNADTPLIPASNQKILTAVAVLARFGPTHRFSTTLYADRRPDEQGKVGRLYVEGGGDPALTSEEWWMLAGEVVRAGVRGIAEGIVLDDSALDRLRWHDGWGDIGSRAYHAPIGALSANYGAFTIEIRGDETPGKPVRAHVEPPVPYLALSNRARTGPAKSRNRLQLGRTRCAERECVRLAGAVPAGSGPRVYHRSVLDPAAYAGAVLRMQLEARGVEVAGTVSSGEVPAGAIELAVFEGKPLGEIVRLFMKYSNNAIAETLLKNLGGSREGAPGSWPKGVSALRSTLAELGVSLDGARIVDGSGLSRQNRVSPRVFVETLRAARQSFRIAPELMAALPIAARDGTLEKRAAAVAERVRAKTGLLSGVTGLSGYARTDAGRDLVFSILVNGYDQGDYDAMRAVDRFVAVLVGASTRVPVDGG